MPTRPIEKALRGITVSAHFSHDGHGGLHPVKAHVRWVDQKEFTETEARRIEGTHKAIIALRDGGGKPPYLTTNHMRLGPVGITYARLQHIVENRKKRGQDVEACLKGIAECLVAGGLKVEPPTKDNKRDNTPQIWATHGSHQVTLTPFWDEKGLPTSKVPTWVVTAYEMEPFRVQETREAKDVEIRIENRDEQKK